MTPQSELVPLEAGDEGFIVYSQRAHGPRKAKVVKVGRRWATLDVPYTRVDRHTHYLDGDRHRIPGRFYTPEAMRHRERMEAAGRVIQEAGLSFRLGARWADGDALALADWLRQRFPDTLDSAGRVWVENETGDDQQ